MLRRGGPQVGDDAAMNCMRIIEIDDLLGEVRAVASEQRIRFAIRC